ncbi:DUF427 domain-containing protein [Amycolatopsis halotolerans]|uniref:DUF427 domain-containing protein n=1 Tax=Amycolatopsis halotolerans TaxID=330083 RepID=A0ABV7QEB5_9PSEU
MMRAVWNGIVLAEAPRTVRVEGNHYFPPDSVNTGCFAASRTKTLCPWKGLASYYNLTSERGGAPDIAWYYPRPSPLARRIKNHVAFCPEVTVEGEPVPRPGGGFWTRLFGRPPAS